MTVIFMHISVDTVLICFQLLMIPLIMSVLYVWAQFNKDTVVSFWFGTRFKVHHGPLHVTDR